MSVAIVTDSAAAVPAELAAQFAVSVVPMWIHADGQTVAAGERPLGELLGDERVTTSAPTPGDFEAVVRARLDAGADGAVVLTITSEMSASHESAALAARDVEAQSGAPVRVVDTGTAAGGQALVVL